jgi:hypothetical protein
MEIPFQDPKDTASGTLRAVNKFPTLHEVFFFHSHKGFISETNNIKQQWIPPFILLGFVYYIGCSKTTKGSRNFK